MPFIKNILENQSVAIVGTAKNTGKTTCLNYVLRRLREEGKSVALTSIGVDGEERDVLYDTPKPRIVLHEGMIFVTSEKDFALRECQAEVLAVSERSTPLGRLITARAKSSGKVVISGPSDSAWLQTMIAQMIDYQVDITLVDGALSRMSLASPAVTDAMILCTGAACSPALEELVRKTKFRQDLINLDAVNDAVRAQLQSLETGVWQRKPKTDEWQKIADSVFAIEDLKTEMLTNDSEIYISGAVTERFFKHLNALKNQGIRLIATDFTKLFITPMTYANFTRNYNQINVLQKASLLAVCTNPTSPEGTRLNAETLRSRLQSALGVAVYDIFEISGIK